MTGATKQPLTAEQWEEIVHAKTNDPTLDPATAPARKDPKWEKFWTLQLLGARCVQVARGARQDSVRGRDGRRRRSVDPVPRHLPFAQVRPGVRDARQDADLPEHLCRRGRQGPRGDARCADPVLVARQLRGRAVRTDRRRPDRHAGAAGCRAQLHDRGQPQGRPPEQRDARERRRVDGVEPARRGHRRAEEPRRTSAC